MSSQASFGVLVVDDEDMIRTDTMNAIEDAGYATYGASNAMEAVDYLKRFPDIKVAVLDVDLTGKVDGLQLSHIIRNSWPQIGIVVSSGLVRIFDEDLPSQSVFLPKPYSFADILRFIKAF
jgi:CheY-like chemotaxis protein